MRDYESTVETKRKSSTYLTEQQKWEVAKYCIESKVVTQDSTGAFANWRVGFNKAATEINNWSIQEKMGIPAITGHHVKQSVVFYNLVADLTNNLPAVPAVQETMEMDMLKIEISKLKAELEKTVAALSVSDAALSKAQTNVHNYRDRFTQIRKLATT